MTFHDESYARKQHHGRAQSRALEMQYKSSYVRILDAKRRFLEAATSYYDLSQAQQLSDGEAALVRASELRPCRCFVSAGLQRLAASLCTATRHLLAVGAACNAHLSARTAEKAETEIVSDSHR